MSSARKRGAIAKAHAETERLRQDLLISQHYRSVFQGVAEELGRRIGAMEEGFVLPPDEKLMPTVITFYAQLLKDSGRTEEAEKAFALAAEKRKALNERAKNDPHRPGDGLSRRSQEG